MSLERGQFILWSSRTKKFIGTDEDIEFANEDGELEALLEIPKVAKKVVAH